MTIAEFRKNKDLMLKAKKLKADPTLQQMLGLIKDEHVMYDRISSVGLPAEDMKLRLGQIEGYNLCLEKFKLLFEDAPEPQQQIKATFQPPKTP